MIPTKLATRLTEQQCSFLNCFFAQCNESFFSNVILKTYPANHTLMVTDDTCSYVYILLKGRLQAIEERVVNEPYSFTELSAIEIVGDFELFTRSASRIVTLTTLEKSLFLVIPSTDYIAWIKNDANALFIRTKMLIRQIVAQTQFDRQNFFLDNHTRLLYFLLSECNHAADAEFPIKIKYTRPEIASKLGCSSRTINRAISALQEERLLTVKHGKIHVSTAQYAHMKEVLDSETDSSLSVRLPLCPDNS